jgi:hypothetical protein
MIGSAGRVLICAPGGSEEQDPPCGQITEALSFRISAFSERGPYWLIT